MIDYYAVSDKYTPYAKEMCHKIKGETVSGVPLTTREHGDAIDIAAREMAAIVPKNAVLVPIPSRHGYATDTLLLATRIGRLSGNAIKDVLRGNDRTSSYEAKKTGVSVDFGFYMTEEIEGPIVYVDNVISSGATARAAYGVKAGVFLVYAAVTKVAGFRHRTPMAGFHRTGRLRRAMLL